MLETGSDISGRLAAGPGEAVQQQRLGHAGALEHGQVQALVRAVRPRVRVLDAGDEDLRVTGRSSAYAVTNGIEPPTPMSTAGAPHASARAACRPGRPGRRAARRTGRR